MNSQKLRAYLSGKKIAVLGLGISNRPLMKKLASWGLDLAGFDLKTPDDPVLREFIGEVHEIHPDVVFHLGLNYLEQLRGFDVIFKTPHFRSDNPVLVTAKQEGAIITSEMEAFLATCPATVIGVTGSDGKTTTTTLIAEVMDAERQRVFLGGNIGTPLFDQMDRIKEDDQVIVELSSFQLMDMSYSPDIACITNLQPNHLDFHKDFAEYRDAKYNIFRHQDMFDTLILNGSQEGAAEIAMHAKGGIRWVEERALEFGPLYGLDDDVLFVEYEPGGDKRVLIDRSEIKMPGRHNAVNLLMAAATTDHSCCLNSFQEVARSFGGVAHRMEYVATIDGVKFYNASIDSSPQRTAVTLKAYSDMETPVVAIMGGKDKKLDYSILGNCVPEAAKAVILWGENAPLIEEAILASWNNFPIAHVDDYEQAVEKAMEAADEGDAVVLTPSGTSFDHFQNFEARGNAFKSAVTELKENRKNI